MVVAASAGFAMFSAIPAAGTPAAITASEAAFGRLTALVGEWEGIQQGVPVRLTYTLTADGTALMEQAQPAGSPAMITMFTVDGDRLLATHYCSMGNQPQMATGPIPEDAEAGLSFSLVRVTGMKTPGDFHNTGLTVKLDDPDHLTQEWSYAYRGKHGRNVFRFTRKR
jgi:hypothetical protein